MPRFFKLSQTRDLGQKILIFIRTEPVWGRAYSTSSASPVLLKEEKIEAKRMEALRKYGLLDLDIIWPRPEVGDVDHIETNPASTQQMYGKSDLSLLPVFQGGWLNYGLYKHPFLYSREITTEQRIDCSREMYRMAGDLAQILKGHNILEVGSGLGYGATFLGQNYPLKLVIGLDISPAQIERAKRFQISGIASGKLRFALGEAESMPFTENSFDSVISVEAAQHFSSMEAFSKEALRVLKPGGKFVVTSFFPASKEGLDALNAIVPDYETHGSQRTVEEVKKEFSRHMENVEARSIGENVWEGLSRWLDQIGYQRQWTKIWPALYKKGLIDYMVYEGRAPKEKPEALLQETPASLTFGG